MKELNASEQEGLKEEHYHLLGRLIGTKIGGQGLNDRVRRHQGWWRACVAALPEGQYYDNRNKIWKRICNRAFSETSPEDVNFLSQEAFLAAKNTLAERTDESSGIVDAERLNYNLLSSQPLCFNFFGEFMGDREFGLKVLRAWWPELTELRKVMFEYAPKENFTGDSSAFDVAFEVAIGDNVGLIGLECKYTDQFSYRPKGSKTNYGDQGNKNHDSYKKVYTARSHCFLAPYYDFVRHNGCNQLFRNQLIAESVVHHGLYAFARTGLFCYQKDDSAKALGTKFGTMLADPKDFTIISYAELIAKMQRLDLSWKRREWTMLLWARYCALSLSDSKATVL
tara:strand:- start:564 stop:1580 length:1017 start_codon:yes stop_codon:yes gene_type:complete